MLGFIFVFSGFVKGIDLMGFSYRFNEFFTVIGLPELPHITLVMSYLLSGAEFLLGVALLTGIFINLTAWTAVFFMGLFFVFTFILAVFNLVSDCGCFGDAIKLTNWETFYKNVVFSGIVVFIFTSRKKFVFRAPLWMEWATCITTIVFFTIVSIYSYRHLPIIDFIPYSIGSKITEKMSFPANAPKDKYETTFKYKNIKSGIVKEFSEKDYPWRDSLNWKLISSQTNLIKKGYAPPIHDFVITSLTGFDITDIILSDTSYSFLFISPNLNTSNPKGFLEAQKIFDYCSKTGLCKFYAVTSSTPDDIQKVRKRYNIKYDFYSGDETTLKTIIRANPGLILLKSGIVIGKWHYNDMYKVSLDLEYNFISKNLTNIHNNGEWTLSISILLGLGLIISLFWAISMYFENKPI